jgi:Holliday junction DNA helicase RuvA
MIASLEGKVLSIRRDSIVVGVGGVGLHVFVPRNVLEQLQGTGRTVFLYTRLIVRETELALYGFDTEDDLLLFDTLLGVNGVGPKVALSILGTLSPELLRGAVMREETAVLQRVPGIGKKTAERVMFQLRDKLDLTAEAAGTPLVSDVDADVIDILTSLGFSIVEAQSALQHIPREVASIDDRVQAALQYLDQGS